MNNLNRNKLFSLAKLLILFILIYFLLRKVDIQAINRITASLSAEAVIFAILLCSIVNLLVAIRWHYIITNLSASNLTVYESFIHTYISIFCNQALPSSLGGDAARGLLARSCGIKFSAIINSLIMDRIITIYVLCVLSIAGILLMTGVNFSRILSYIYILIFIFVISLPIIVILLPKILVSISGLQSSSSTEKFNFLFFVQEYVADLSTFIKTPSQILIPITSCFFGFLILGIILYIFVLSMHIDISFINILAVSPLIFLIAAVPLSVAGWGFRETAMVYLLYHFHIPKEESLALSIAFGLTILISSFPGALMLPLYRNDLLSSKPNGENN